MVFVLVIADLLYLLCLRLEMIKLRSFFANLMIVVALIGATNSGFAFTIFVYSITLTNFIFFTLYFLIFLAIRNILKHTKTCNHTKEFNFSNYAPSRHIPGKRGRHGSTTDPYPALLYLFRYLFGVFLTATFFGAGWILTLVFIALLAEGYIYPRDLSERPYRNNNMNYFAFVREVSGGVIFILNVVNFYTDIIFISYISVSIHVLFTIFSVIAMIVVHIKKRQELILLKIEEKKKFSQI